MSRKKKKGKVKKNKEFKAEQEKRVAEAAQTEDSKYIVDYILTCKKEADDAMKERRLIWREMWQLYQSKQDNSKKASWQSKAFSPKIFMQVERGASMVKKAVMQIDRLFSTQPKDPSIEDANEKADNVDKAIKEAMGESRFSPTYSVSTKVAFLLGLGITKVYYQDDKLQFDDIDPLNMYTAPDYLPNLDEPPRYRIERKSMELAELRRTAAEVNKESGTEVFDMDVLDEINEDYKTKDTKDRELTRKGLTQYNNKNKMVEVLEFWGDIVDKEGLEVEENMLCMVANERHLIRKQENPFDHKSPPYIDTVPMVYPQRGVSGIAFVEPMVKLQYTFNNIMNMTVDNLNFSVNKVFEYNANGTDEPHRLTSVYPGKMIKKNNDQQLLREVKTSNIGSDVFNTMTLINTEMEAGSAVTEIVQGLPGSGSKTATEMEMKGNMAQGLFDTIARDIEVTSLKPLLEMVHSLLVQFHDKGKELEGEYKFLVGGLSLIVNQRKQIEVVTQTLGLALKNQEIHDMTDVGMLYQKLLAAYNLTDVYVSPEELAERQAAELEANPQAAAEKASADAQEVISQGPEAIAQKIQELKGGG